MGNVDLRLWDWTNANAAAVLRYLLDRDVSGFSPYAAPPMTEGKAAMIAQTKEPLARWLQERIEDEEAPFEKAVTTWSDIEWSLKATSFKGVSSRKVAGFLQDLGAVKWGDGRKVQLPQRCGAKESYAWIVRDVAMWASKSASEITKELGR